MTGMEVEVVDTMVLIEMVVDLAGAIEIVVLKEDHEMTAIIRTILVPMDVIVQETSVQGRKNSPARILCCLRCFDAQFHYSYIMIRGFSLKNSESPFGLKKLFCAINSVNFVSPFTHCTDGGVPFSVKCRDLLEALVSMAI
ncbi:hypothetical protein EUGRSUZ_L00182 [Eucalyptus grandis]|uniref:Uncharacterized protein n=1 Tax=Eucalyptus grandis TaxID=71139 RepID=A0A058ZY32_EUCGR|nr:hypothetical protein EUGRSUZ_L00182 [Eucalyptus grandis]